MTVNHRGQKVFGIGLSGTGSHSLVAALKTLGYRSKHCPKRIEQFDEYDALADIPVSGRFEFLDLVYPKSRFILTTRDLEGWLANRRKKRSDDRPRGLWALEARFNTYGRIETDFDEMALTTCYWRHHDRVARYFAGRPEDLLTLDIVGGEGWEQLCPFLGMEIPDRPFPKVSSDKNRRRNGLGRRLKDAARSVVRVPPTPKS